MIPWKRAMKRLMDRAREFKREPNITNANLLNDAIAAAGRVVDIAEGQPTFPGFDAADTDTTPLKPVEVNQMTSKRK